MAGIFSWYNSQLLRNPVATKTITAVAIACAGDIACQKLEGAAVVDKRRTGRMAAWVTLMTPPVHYWYGYLVRRFPHSTVKRVIADQGVFAPIGLVGFFYGMGLMEHGTLDSGAQKMRNSFVPVMLTNWAVWPAVQYANFRFVPLQLQVLVVNAVSFFWSMYISRAAHSHGHATSPVVMEYGVIEREAAAALDAPRTTRAGPTTGGSRALDGAAREAATASSTSADRRRMQ